MALLFVCLYVLFYARGSGATDWSSGVRVGRRRVEMRTAGRFSLKQDVYYTQKL
jgi:hypothetical protein